MSSKQQKPSFKWALLTLGIVFVVVGANVIVLSMRPDRKVTNFEECIQAGGARLESYPEQCLYDGTTYMNKEQLPPTKESGFIGMKEDEALRTAKENHIIARVVERDGEALPVTMDFVHGRHNLYVRDGHVYNVQVEGETDTP